MALNAVLKMLIDGVWTTVGAYMAEGWSAQVGPDVQAGLQPNKLEVTLANPDLSMDPSNPSSPRYGKIGRNTPTRLEVGGSVILAAEASAWRPTRDLAHVANPARGRSSVGLTAEGLQRRLGRWQDPLESPMRRQISSYSGLLGYWPFEDGTEATSLNNIVDDGDPATFFRTVSLAADDGPGGSDRCLTIGSDGVVGGYFDRSNASGYQLSFCVKLPAVPTSGTNENVLVWTDTVGRVWYWRTHDTGWQIEIQDGVGGVLATTNVGYGTGTDVTNFLRLRMKVTVSAGTVTYEPAWYNQDKTSSYGTTGTFSASTTGQPYGWQINGNPWTDGASYAHLFATTDTTLDIINSYDVHAAFNGYLAERAGDRFYRLMGENGLNNRYTDGDKSVSVPMGRQKPGLLIDLLTECAIADAGLLYDEPTVHNGLTLRLYNFLLNRPVALALQYGTGGRHVSPPLAKVIDDEQVVNDVTITNWDGSQFHVERTDGPLSVSLPPDGVGRYKKTLDVSLKSTGGGFQQRAYWDRAIGTITRPRYPSIALDLTLFPAFYIAATDVRPGDTISVTGLEADTVYLRVMTKRRVGGMEQHDVVIFDCLPADIWLSGEYHDGVSRFDSKYTTLQNDETTTDTAMTFRMSQDTSQWSTTGTPYDVLIEGERITVTSMGARTGTGPWSQTATVVRSVNGVVRAHVAGTPVRVFRPAYWTLRTRA